MWVSASSFTSASAAICAACAAVECPVTRAEARAIFPACELPRDFDTIDIPLGDRGAPTLIRFGEAPKAPI